MNRFQFVNDLNWLTKLAVAPQPVMLDPQYDEIWKVNWKS